MTTGDEVTLQHARCVEGPRWPVAKQVLAGLVSLLPGGQRILAARGTGGHASAGYHYGVWLRQLRVLQEAGASHAPLDVAEVGPGDMLGIGLAALLSGSRSYVAVDAVPHARAMDHSDLLDEVHALLSRREAADPGAEFPSDMLSSARLDAALAPERISTLRNLLSRSRMTGEPSCVAVSSDAATSPTLRYVAPWSSDSSLPSESVDLVCSQAAMEHVDDYEACYAAQARWLRPGGFALHHVDFDCHWTARRWNGHWGHGDAAWRVLRGRRPYLINKAPCAWHLRAMRDHGLQPVLVRREYREDGIAREALALRYRDLEDEDLRTAAAMIVARKPM